MGRGETAPPVIRWPSPLCGLLFTLPALRGGQGGDEPRPLAFVSAVLRPLGLPTLALPMNGEGRNCPIRSSDGPPFWERGRGKCLSAHYYQVGRFRGADAAASVRPRCLARRVVLGGAFPPLFRR